MKNVSKTLRNKANRSGDKFSPCLTPTCDAKKSDRMPLSLTHDLIDLYMFIITSMTFPVIPYENNFFHNVALLIESNALL